MSDADIGSQFQVVMFGVLSLMGHGNNLLTRCNFSEVFH